MFATHDRGKRRQLRRLELNKEYGSLGNGEHANHVR